MTLGFDESAHLNAKQSAEYVLTLLDTAVKDAFSKAIEGIKFAGLTAIKGGEYDQELIKRAVKFEVELDLRQKRNNFNVSFQVVNFMSETKKIRHPITIALAQIKIPKYERETVPFNFTVENAKKQEEIIKKFLVAIYDINKSDHRIDFICFPELSVPKEAFEKIKAICDQDNSPFVLAGFEYEKLMNPSKIFCEKQVFSQSKTKFSKFEDSPYNEQRMVSGDNIFIFRTERGNFSVLLCSEYGDARACYMDLIQAKLQALFPNDCLNLLFVLSQNPKPEEFIKWAESDCDLFGIHIALCNNAENGGSAILSPTPDRKDKIQKLANDVQNIICCEVDIRNAPQVMPFVFAKQGLFYTHSVDLSEQLSTIKELLT